MKRRVTDYWLYRQRYALSYSLGIFAIILGLIAAALFVPAGLRQAEMASAVTSGSLTFQEFDPHSVINLPYHLLQRASMSVFGVGELSLKLPSLILGFTAVIGMFMLIKEWFRHNVAVITVLLTATLPGFIFIAQDATPQIFPVAVSIWLLVCGTYVTRRRRPHLLWKILVSLLLALNMYAPLGVYLNIAVISTIMFHPHIRHLSRQLNPNRIVIAAACALIILAPLLYSLTMQPSLGLQLAGIPSHKPDFVANAIELGKSLVWQNGHTAGIYHPVLSLGILLIILIGFGRFLQVKYTARSYIIWLWGVLLLPLLLVNPGLVFIIIPLAMLMIAMGMNTLIAEWYRLFPYNPYARILGLIPLSVIVVGIVLSAASRYTYNYYYNPEIANTFSNDTRLLKETLRFAEAEPEKPLTVIVTSEKVPYYRLLARYDRRFTVTDSATATPLPYIMGHGFARQNTTDKQQPSYIAVNDHADDSDRFYLYTAPSK